MDEKVSGGPTSPQTGQDAVAEASEQFSQTVRKTADTVSRTASDLKDQAVRGMESGKDQASQQFAGAADSIRQGAGQLRDRQQTWLADFVDRGAEQLDRVSETLRSNDLQGLLNQLDGFARRQPALFAGASMIAGFALARMARVALDQGTASPTPTTSPVAPSTPPEPTRAGVL
jgi:uncharacterized phage infection (PIP) family protein YhgE